MRQYIVEFTLRGVEYVEYIKAATYTSAIVLAMASIPNKDRRRCKDISVRYVKL